MATRSLICRYEPCRTSGVREALSGFGQKLQTSERVRSCGVWCLLLLLGLTIGWERQAVAQSSAVNSQEYLVHVPPVLTGSVDIHAPADVLISHDATDNEQPFPQQFWDAGCNASNGATVVFQTRSAFRNTGAGPVDRRNARLDISLMSADPGSGWVVTVPSATTNYSAGISGERVSTRAESFAAGNATFRVNVTFITDDASTLKMGNYSMRVTGTITAK